MGHPQFGKLQICLCRQAELNARTQDRLFRHSNLDELAELTFETFKSRGHIGTAPSQADALEKAFNSAQHFARQLEGWLLLQGRYGCGKTHLAASIANFASSLGVPTLFITLPDMLDSLRHAYQDTSTTFEDKFEEIRTIQLLVLDDFGTQNMTGWAQEKLFQLLNFRYINRLPTVITTNLQMEDIDERIRSRLQDDIVRRQYIMAPDYRRPYDDTSHHPLSSLEHLRNRTFANFDLRGSEKLERNALESLNAAYKAAIAFAEKPSGWLVLLGGYGCGKTHLAAAIANQQSEKGYPPIFVMVTDLLDHLRATFAPENPARYDRVFDQVRAAPLLILDDLGAQAMTPWVKEKLYQLINHRYNAELPTVITIASVNERPLDDIDKRISTRLEDRRLCQMHIIGAGSYTSLQDPRRGSKSKR